MKIFKNYNIISISKIFIIGYIVFFAVIALAATISNNPLSNIGAKDVFITDVLLDTEGETINTVEGSIKLSNSLVLAEVRDISIAGSSINLWPRKPSLSEKGDVISFAGGIPGGITGKNIPLFKVIVSVGKKSELQLSSNDIKTYVNDGKGTSINVVTKFSPIVVGEAKDVPIDAWKENISDDNTPPEDFEITVLQDENMYNNNKYISYSTVDVDSGISHYEVKEGRRQPVRAGETYVLIDQTGETNIVVTAFDKAGNARSVAFVPDSRKVNWFSVALGVVAGFVLITLGRFLIRKRRHV